MSKFYRFPVFRRDVFDAIVCFLRNLRILFIYSIIMVLCYKSACYVFVGKLGLMFF